MRHAARGSLLAARNPRCLCDHFDRVSCTAWRLRRGVFACGVLTLLSAGCALILLAALAVRSLCSCLHARFALPLLQALQVEAKEMTK